MHCTLVLLTRNQTMCGPTWMRRRLVKKRNPLHPNLWLCSIRSFTWIFCVSWESNLIDQRLHYLHWTTHHLNLETNIKLISAVWSQL